MVIGSQGSQTHLNLIREGPKNKINLAREDPKKDKPYQGRSKKKTQRVLKQNKLASLKETLDRK